MKSDVKAPGRCIIIDDEPAARQVLKSHIDQLPWLSLVASCASAMEGLRCIQESAPEIVFLDMSMPEVSGLDLLEMVPSLGSSVIVTSAHAQYAVDGYDYDIISFLTKPVSYKSFVKAVTKATSRRQWPRQLPWGPTGLAAASAQDFPIQTPHFDNACLWVKFDRRFYAIPYQDIYFIEGQHNYVVIHYKGFPALRTRATIGEMSRGLPDFFVKTHRSYIVNRYQVSSIEGNTVHLLNDFKVSIAKEERSEIIIRLTTGYTRSVTG